MSPSCPFFVDLGMDVLHDCCMHKNVAAYSGPSLCSVDFTLKPSSCACGIAFIIECTYTPKLATAQVLFIYLRTLFLTTASAILEHCPDMLAAVAVALALIQMGPRPHSFVPGLCREALCCVHWCALLATVHDEDFPRF